PRMDHKRTLLKTTTVESAAISLIALGLYLPFLAIQYDTNGIVEAESLEAGALATLLNKNHILMRPIGFIAYHAFRHLGYSGNSLVVLQTIDALCGAAALGFAYAAFKSVTQDRLAAVLGAVWLGTSFVFWYFSTDAAYITLAGMFAATAMALLRKPPRTIAAG